MAYVYKITNNMNGKFYIGKTQRSSLVRRWAEHRRKALDKNYRHPLYDGIRRHGLENFSIEVLEECNIELLDEREKFWIINLAPVYNLTTGGEGGDTFTRKPEHMKEETRKKLSVAAKKKAQDPEYIRKLSVASKKNWNNLEYSKKISCATKLKWNNESYRTLQSDIARDRWQTETYRERITRKAKENSQNPEYLQKVSAGVKRAIESRKDVWSECKKGRKNGRWLGVLEMYYPSGELYKFYESAVECKKDTGIVAHTIRTKARSGEAVRRGVYVGYTFRFNTEIK